MKYEIHYRVGLQAVAVITMDNSNRPTVWTLFN